MNPLKCAALATLVMYSHSIIAARADDLANLSTLEHAQLQQHLTKEVPAPSTPTTTPPIPLPPFETMNIQDIESAVKTDLEYEAAINASVWGFVELSVQKAITRIKAINAKITDITNAEAKCSLLTKLTSACQSLLTTPNKDKLEEAKKYYRAYGQGLINIMRAKIDVTSEQKDLFDDYQKKLNALK